MSISRAEPDRRSLLQRRSVYLAAITLLIALGLAAEFRSYASPDTGFLLDEAARVLDGSRLYVDLIDMNPPLIVVLNMAAVWLARWLGVSEILMYRLGCTAGLLVTLTLSLWLLRRLLPDHLVLRRVIALLLAFVLFDLPGHDFGEREHLLLMSAVPYLLLAAARAAGREIPAPQAGLIGLLAGIGLSIKPHFLLLWVAIEAYLRLRRRISPIAITPEAGALAGFLVLYGVATVVWVPEFIGLVRLFAGAYSQFLYDPLWHLLVTGRGALLTVFALLAFAALRRHTRHPELLDVFAVSALASLVAAAAQRKGFSYHLYPAFALGMVLLGLVGWDARQSARSRIRSVYLVISVSVVATVILVACARNVAAAMRLNRGWEEVQLERLISAVRPRAQGQGVYVMSYHIGSGYPLINYSDARSASRFPQLWILGASYLEQLKGSYPLRYRAPEEMSPTERYLNQAVLEDLRDQRPKVLLVLEPARDLRINGWRRLDYIAYFSRDPAIAAILQQYQLVADLQGYLVYERVGDGMERIGPPPTVQPPSRDIVQGPNIGSVPAPIRHPGFQLALLVFVVSVVFASIAERARKSDQVAPESAWR